MKTVSSMKEPLEELEFALHRVLIHVILICDVLFASRIYQAIGLFLQPLILGSCAAIIIFYCAYTAIRGHILIPLMAVGYVALVMTQLTVFADKLWLPVNTNAFFQYIWVMSFVPFAGVCLAGGRTYLLKCVIGYGTGYCCFYALVSIMQMAGVLPGKILAGLVSDLDFRGARIFLYSGLAALTYFYWLVQIRTRVTWVSLSFFLICTLASLLSLSRVYLLVIFCLSIVFMLSPRPAFLRILAISVLGLGTTFVLSGMLVPAFNPFDLFANDASGAYRALEYEVMRDRIFADPLWGFGMSPTSDASKPFLGPYLIFPGDVGSVGVWFEFGLIGLGLYLVILWRCSTPQRSLPTKYGWPLFLTGTMLTAYGAMAPLAIAPGGATMTGLIFGVGLTAHVQQRNHKRRSQPLSGSLRQTISAR
jgi:hypothetical protein